MKISENSDIPCITKATALSRISTILANPGKNMQDAFNIISAIVRKEVIWANLK